MVNIKQKLEEIDKYFNNLSIDEFEKVLERNGINEISSKKIICNSNTKEVKPADEHTSI